ncbi:MAG: hypothetical protein C0469_01995 [Cyanobacteria bacterium DS2.3.42]|nr:hypothetical protein [Cyanobacteria bacterium DS2.3.42]
MTAAPQERTERRAYVSPDLVIKAAMDPTIPKRRATDKIPLLEPRRSGMRAAATWAILIFCLGNFALSFYNPIEFDPYKYLYKGWTWWGFDEMKKTNFVHNVALLGSSLMVSAVAGVDANYLNKTLDLSQYHRAKYLDDNLITRFGGDFRSLNLSIPGQMPSDAYMTLKAMVATANRPDIVVYGIAPRDFIDSTMSSAADTEAFRFLRRIVNIDDVASHVFRTPIARLEWFINRTFYISQHAADFQLLFKETTEKVVGEIVPCPPATTRFTWWDRIKLLPSYLPGEIRPQAVMTGPISEAAARKRWINNAPEYLERYKHPDKHVYQTQFYFLQEIAKFCKKERIELVLVNMPLTSYNIHLLGPPRYMSFVGDLHVFALKNNVAFYDMCTPSNYSQQDFHDSVHLNAYGGRKFFDQLVNIISLSGRTRQAFTLSGKDLERHQAVANTKTPLYQ